MIDYGFDRRTNENGTDFVTDWIDPMKPIRETWSKSNKFIEITLKKLLFCAGLA